MTAADVLALAKARGVTIRASGNDLDLVAARKPDRDLLDAMANSKAEILAVLQADAIFEAAARARPPDVNPEPWQTALRGLRAFVAAGHGDEAERLGWPRDELYAVPPVWARVDLCGVGLSLGDSEVTEITSTRIGIRTASGAPQGFYRKPAPDYALAYRERIRVVGDDAHKEEVRLRALEAVVNLYRSHHPGVDVDTAKAVVLATLKEREGK